MYPLQTHSTRMYQLGIYHSEIQGGLYHLPNRGSGLSHKWGRNSRTIRRKPLIPKRRTQDTINKKMSPPNTPIPIRGVGGYGPISQF